MWEQMILSKPFHTALPILCRAALGYHTSISFCASFQHPELVRRNWMRALWFKGIIRKKLRPRLLGIFSSGTQARIKIVYCVCVTGLQNVQWEDEVRLISSFNDFSELQNSLSPEMGQSLRSKDFKWHGVYKLKPMFWITLEDELVASAF